MENGILMKFITFWAFMIGVAVFGRIFGFLDDTRHSVIILVAAALIFVVWELGRSKARQRREEQEYEEQQRSISKGSGKRNKR
ncbi:MAG: hypothetical protein IJL99_05710 [Firmicutes bacterium]|nr:hypothetical protein [Bacillota bacterium]